jgi:hypothetical protein
LIQKEIKFRRRRRRGHDLRNEEISLLETFDAGKKVFLATKLNQEKTRKLSDSRLQGLMARSKSYDRELQRQRCKNLQRHG